MKIVAVMKDGNVKEWQWHKDFALVCLRYIKELQEDAHKELINYISLIRDNGEVVMKKGKKMYIVPLAWVEDKPEEYTKLSKGIV